MEQLYDGIILPVVPIDPIILILEKAVKKELLLVLVQFLDFLKAWFLVEVFEVQLVG
jgi:hypothetical protein